MKIHSKSVLLPSANLQLESAVLRGLELQRKRGESFDDIKSASMKPLTSIAAIVLSGAKTFAAVVFFYTVLDLPAHFAKSASMESLNEPLSPVGFYLSQAEISEAIPPPPPPPPPPPAPAPAPFPTNMLVPLTPPTGLNVRPL